MGIMDKITGAAEQHKDKIADAVDQHADKIEGGLDQAGAFVDEKTGGKFSEHIETGTDKAADALDGLDGKDDDFGNATTPQN